MNSHKYWNFTFFCIVDVVRLKTIFQQQFEMVVESYNKYCNQRFILGVIGCFGGCFIHLVIGSLYQWGIISIYVTSYYKIQDPNVTLQGNAIAFPAMMLCIGLTIKLGIYLSTITHPLLVMGLTVVSQAACVFASSYIPTMGGFIIVYGCMIGLFSGLNFMLTVFECNKYFPGKKMYVNGIVLTGTGLGSVVFGLFSYNFLNPNKVAPVKGYYIGNAELEQIAAKVPECLRWLALLFLGFGLMGVLMMSYVCIDNRRKQNQKKKQEAQKKQKDLQQTQKRQQSLQKIQPQIASLTPQNLIQNSKPFSSNQKQNNSHQIKETQATCSIMQAIQFPKQIKEIICTKVFWKKVGILFFGCCGLFLLNGNYKTYVKTVISDDNFLTIVGVVGSLGNGCSRFFWNLLFNYTGYRFVTVLNLSIQIIIFATIRFTVNYPGVYLFLILMNGVCMGGILVEAPTFLQIVFGQVVGSNSYGIFWEVFALANLLQYGFVSGLSPIITFDGIIYICLGMSAIAMLIVVLGNFKAPWNNPQQELGYFKHCVKKEQHEVK